MYQVMKSVEQAMKVYVLPAILGLLLAFLIQLMAIIALDWATHDTPVWLTRTFNLLKSGVCYLLFPAILVFLSVADQRGKRQAFY